MLVTVIQTDRVDTARQLIQSVIHKTDIVELRFDYWPQLDFKQIKLLRAQLSVPMIFTLRQKSQGGLYAHDEKTRLQQLQQLCDCQPVYVDLEYDVPQDFLNTLQKKYPTIQFICSYHDFEKTDADLSAVLRSMQHPIFSYYKIAMFAQSTVDALRLLKFMADHQTTHRLIGISMGELGQCTRVLGPIVGSAMTYASLNRTQVAAPGQYSVEELQDIFHIKQLKSDTKIYALLGDPITRSPGHVVHNHAMRVLNKNAVYVKLRVTAEELSEVISYCRTLPFAGLSVTIPLKEIIVPLLHEIDADAQSIKAINTVKVDGDHWLGCNTDGIAVANLLAKEMDLSQQKIALLGAGGAARAIIYALRQRGATVMIFNRTLARAQQLAQEFSCEAYAWQELIHLKQLSYTVVINTLPEKVFFEIELQNYFQSEYLLPNTVAMDCVYYPLETTFLKIARQVNARCIPGYEMYVAQALLQLQYWLAPTVAQLQTIEQFMREYFSSGKFSDTMAAF